MTRGSKALGKAGGAAAGLLVALACAATAEQPAEGAGPSGGGGALSTFVTHAQRGEVSPPDLDDVEHMCALLTSCDRLPIPPGMIPGDFQSCVKRFTSELASPEAISFSLTMRECGLESVSCTTLRNCALRGANIAACDGRGHAGPVGFCDVDGRAITCFRDQVLAVRDCTRGGEQCVVSEGNATCTLGPCPSAFKDGDRPQCSASGTHILHCEKGKLVSLDCAAFGLRCSTASDGTAGCATASPGCAAGSKRCDASTTVGCFNGHEVRVDCADAGLACTAGPGATPVGACVEPASRGAASGCDPSVKAVCDGASIKYCFAGRPRSYFCKALGFNRCEGGRGGVRCAM